MARLRKLAGLTAPLVVLMVSAGCGSRLSHQRLLADEQGSTVSASSGDSSVAGGLGAASDAGVSSGTIGVGASARQGAVVSAGGSGSVTGQVLGPQSGAVSGPGSSADCSGTKSAITIGSVGEQTGLVGSLVEDGPKAVQAWVADMNAKGGLHCHPLKYVVVDDGGDPSRNQALTQQLVEQDHVTAFVQADAPIAGQASVAYLTQNNIPVIGSEAGSEWFYSSPDYFPQASSGHETFAGFIAAIATVGKSQRRTRLAVVSCIEVPICSGLYKSAPALAAKDGVTLVYNSQASLTQPDFTAICQSAKSAGADLFAVALDGNSIERLARSCNSVQYQPLLAANSSTVGPGIAADPILNGMVVGLPVLPWFETANPAIGEYQQVLKQYAPGLTPAAGSIVGWVSAKLFQTAAESVADPSSSQQILAGLWSIHGNDLGSLTQPLTFLRGQNAPAVNCYWIMQIEHGTFISPNGGQRTCDAS